MLGRKAFAKKVAQTKKNKKNDDAPFEEQKSCCVGSLGKKSRLGRRKKKRDGDGYNVRLHKAF